jgi:hypothetical protein
MLVESRANTAIRGPRAPLFDRVAALSGNAAVRLFVRSTLAEARREWDRVSRTRRH